MLPKDIKNLSCAIRVACKWKAAVPPTSAILMTNTAQIQNKPVVTDAIADGCAKDMVTWSPSGSYAMSRYETFSPILT